MTIRIHSPAAPPARDPRRAGAAPAHGAERLRRELDAARDDSPVCQLLRRTLGGEDRGLMPGRTPSASPESPRTAPAPEAAAMPRPPDAATLRVALDVERSAIPVPGPTVANGQVPLTRINLTLAHARPEVQAQPPVQRSDPLALDLDGRGLATTGIEAGVRFDIDADGRPDPVSVATAGTAFVALDRNGNSHDLFGDQHRHANGFEALRDFDANGDGRIDARDPVFEMLRLVRLHADGTQQLTALAAAGVASIALDWRAAGTALNAYDRIAQLGHYTRTDGSSGTAGDLLLGFRAAD